MNFTPTQDFNDEDLRSSYIKGLNYTVRPGNDLLAAKVEQWIKDGKVRKGTADNSQPGAASMKGTGTVN